MRRHCVIALAGLLACGDTPPARRDSTATSARVIEPTGIGPLRIGMSVTEARILDLYRGQVRLGPHKYLGPGGHYLVITEPADTVHQIIFETDGQRVLNFRAGRLPAVAYVEGCS